MQGSFDRRIHMRDTTSAYLIFVAQPPTNTAARHYRALLIKIHGSFARRIHVHDKTSAHTICVAESLTHTAAR